MSSVHGDDQALKALLKTLAEYAVSLFRDVDEGLHPHVFLLGFPDKSQPSDDARKLWLLGGSDLDFTGPERQEVPAGGNKSLNRFVYRYKLRRKVLEILDGDPHKRVSYCSRPITVNGHLAFLVIQMERTAYERYAAVQAAKNAEEQPLTFVGCLAQEYLRECEYGLLQISRGSPEQAVIDKSFHELRRRAGHALLNSLQESTDTVSLFEHINSVSGLRYERTEGHGRVLMHPLPNGAGETLMAFDPPVPLEDHRAVRKLLVMCAGNAIITLEDHCITSLARLTAPLDKCGYSIEFQGYYIWELSYRGRVLMRTAYGIPGLPQSTVRKAEFKRILKSVFADEAATDADTLWAFASTVMKQDHGTSIIIAGDAKAEARRLRGQSTPVQPVPVGANVAPHITAIDGSVLLDPLGVCHAIGVIMDGLADSDDNSEPHHNPARGARYNSAVRYVKSATGPTMVVVVSDDGMVDLIYPRAK